MRMVFLQGSFQHLNMPNLRDIALDSSFVMLAFLNDSSNSQIRLKFGAPLSQVFREDRIPAPLLELLKYMNAEGVTVQDVFRRPGNTSEQKKLIQRLSEGKQVRFYDYNFYTLASVLKRFLLNLPGGILGPELEEKLLSILYFEDRDQQLLSIHKILRCLQPSIQRFLTLLFGVWYRITDHHHHHNIRPEAMAKSVTGSIFVNSTCNPTLVNKAAKVMEIMIENFPDPILFGEENLSYFTKITQTNIDRCDSAEHLMMESMNSENNNIAAGRTDSFDEERIKQEFSLDRNNYYTQSLTRQDALHVRQLDRLKRRSEWFMEEKDEIREHLMTSTTKTSHNPKSYRSTRSTTSLPDRRVLTFKISGTEFHC